MTVQLCIFESAGYRKFIPLAYFRPVYDLRLGILSLREKIERAYPGTEVVLQSRTYLAGLLSENGDAVGPQALSKERCLFVNGAAVAGRDFALKVPLDGPDNVVYASGEDIVAARLGGSRLQALRHRLHQAHERLALGEALKRLAGLAEPLDTADATDQAPSLRTPAAVADVDAGLIGGDDFEGLSRLEVDAEVVHYPWELVHRNARAIAEDFAALGSAGRIEGVVYDGAYLVAPERIHVGAGTKIWPGAVLDGESGPVYIGRNVTISSGAVLRGPLFVGEGSLIKSHAEIYGGVSIGPASKIGGEMEATIIQGYSNKQHAGFLGHSYIGEWVNLGAGTNNSDLKNNYGSVRVRVEGEEVDTGETFVGLTMGDHSKSGINSMFNTGTVVGTCCNIFGAGFPAKYIPGFCWGGAGGFTAYDLERCIDVARKVMARRKVQLTPAYEQVMRTVHAITQDERRAFCVESAHRG
ncbi:MAG: GlmU family protein [Gemmatimonadetes bacterium]|nr:GlmU family protein [Gemmatimonadota bacterium]